MDHMHEHHDKPLIADGESRRVPLFKWLFFPLRLLFKVWFGLVFFLSLAVLYVPFRILLYKPSRYRKAFKWMRGWANFLQWAGGMPLTVERRAPLPPPPYVVCCNHGSYLDIIHMYNTIPHYFLFMGKYELLRWPLFNIFFKGMNIAVNRGSRTEAAKSLRRAERALRDGASIALFPEGTIPLTAPRMKHFKDGAFIMAITKQVPIVPVTFTDNWRLFGEPTQLLSRGHPGRARGIIHPHIDTKGMTEADVATLRHRVFDVIEGPLKNA
ncbi:MAG: 1-acyl-sn-glycerol-3-phosphate acyltransferase [Flavobacteriales bacterium]|nr:MAG: 1-acyl-sn-glycerol-3-phosphate acyltransferase [Flavobacteriales bacterium]